MKTKCHDLFHNWGKLLIMSTENGTVTTDKRTCHLGSKWLIVASGFICIFISDGMLYTYGILLVNLVEAFQSSRATTELVAAIYTGVFGIMGPLSGRITEEYGVCTAVIAGSLLKTVGLICSTFVTQLNMLFLTYGILVGLGDSLKTIASFYAVISNFHDNRTLANGIAYCGTGGYFTLIGVIVRDLVGTDKLALAYGLHEMAVCAGISVGGPIGGLVFDKTGSYMPTFVFAGAMMILGGVIGFIIEGSMKRKTISSDDSVTRQESPQSSGANM